MRTTKPDIKDIKKDSFLTGIEKMNPHLLFLCLTLSGSFLVFLFLLAGFNLSYFASSADIYVPTAFYISTAFLAASSVLLMRIYNLFRDENMAAMAKTLGLTLILSLAFALSQVVGWTQLYLQQVYLKGASFGSYMYLITGIHLIHILGGMCYLYFMFFSYLSATTDPVKELIIVTNPYQLVKLKMLYYIWLFLDVVWLIIFINFLVTL